MFFCYHQLSNEQINFLLDKLIENDSLLKNDIELLIEKNKIYWGGDLDF